MIICFDDEKISWWKRWYFRIRNFFFRRRIRKFAAYQFPLIKQTMPSLSLKDLIAIQPMNEPTGEVFYLDFIYKKSWWKRIYEYLSGRKI